MSTLTVHYACDWYQCPNPAAWQTDGPNGMEFACTPHAVEAGWSGVSADAGLGVGHIWTNVRCPAYRSLEGKDCTCNT